MGESAAARRQQAAATEVCAHFKKVLDGFKLYEKGHSALAGFQQGLHQKLTAYLEQFEELSLDVSAFAFSVEGKAVLEADKREEAISQPLFLDGVQKLVVSKGIGAEEAEAFMLLWSSSFGDAPARDSSFVTRLWESNFEHLRVVAVETFAEAGEQQGEAAGAQKLQDRVQAVVSELCSGRLGNLGSGGASARVVRATREDLAFLQLEALADISADELRHHDQSTGAGLPAVGDDELAALAAELAGPRVDLDRSVRALALGAASGSPDELEQVAALAGKIFQGLAEGNALGELASVLAGLSGFMQVDSGQTAERCVAGFRLLGELANPAVLSAAVAGLSDPERASAAEQILSLAPSGAAGALLDLMAALPGEEARQKLCAIVAAKKPSAEALSAAIPRVERDVALELMRLAAQLSPAHALSVCCAALRHPSAEVRRAALKILPRDQVSSATALLEPLVLDEAADLRRAAADLLLVARHPGLLPLVAQLLARPHLDEDERKWAYFALGRLGAAAAPILLREFEANHPLELRCACALALGSAGDASAKPVLLAAGHKLLCPRELKQACEEALKRLEAASKAPPKPASPVLKPAAPAPRPARARPPPSKTGDALPKIARPTAPPPPELRAPKRPQGAPPMLAPQRPAPAPAPPPEPPSLPTIELHTGEMEKISRPGSDSALPVIELDSGEIEKVPRPAEEPGGKKP